MRVLPVFFVPSDQTPPTQEQKSRFVRHLRWSRDRCAELLGGKTFEFAKEEPDVYRASFPLLAYRPLPEDGSPQYTSELLRHYGVDRFTCPYVFAVLFVNPCENHPAGGGRPLNDDFNRGAGMFVISTYALDRMPNFQSTLQHELGHAFGLVHADQYGFPMQTHESIMSYNPKHHTRGFDPSPTPGILVAEDLRALAQNQRVFPGLAFRGTSPRKEVRLGPMTIPDEAPWGVRDGVGYEVFENGRRVRHEPSWNRAAALADVVRRKGTGRHNGLELPAESRGYELFFDGRRAGHEPAWTLAQGIENLRWNRADKPKREIDARFDGMTILLWEPAGYELFLDGVRVGREPAWTREQAENSLRINRERHRGKVVEGRFNGERITS